MSEKKNVENPLYDEDVAELADLYDQFGKVLVDAEPKLTSEAAHSLACTIFIKRSEDRRREEMRAKQEKNAPSNDVAAQSSSGGGDEKECPNCGTILQRRFPKDGRKSKGYFSCGKCKVFVNHDGTTTPWRNQ